MRDQRCGDLFKESDEQTLCFFNCCVAHGMRLYLCISFWDVLQFKSGGCDKIPLKLCGGHITILGKLL